MNVRRVASRRLEEGRVNEEIPPQVEQVLQGSEGAQIPMQGFQIKYLKKSFIVKS